MENYTLKDVMPLHGTILKDVRVRFTEAVPIIPDYWRRLRRITV
jgi:hypothetical protein